MLWYRFFLTAGWFFVLGIIFGLHGRDGGSCTVFVEYGFCTQGWCKRAAVEVSITVYCTVGIREKSFPVEDMLVTVAREVARLYRSLGNPWGSCQQESTVVYCAVVSVCPLPINTVRQALISFFCVSSASCEATAVIYPSAIL